MTTADRVIAVSQYTKSLLVHRYGIPAEKIAVVHNGIEPLSSAPDVGRHHFAPNRQVVVFMGRLTGQKGPEYFLHLARSIQSRNPDVLFVVAGDGDMYRHLLVTTAKHQLSGTVIYSGFVRGTQQATLFNRADIFVMPSLSEPFGLVALEAAQRHTPVILSKQSGVSEVLPHAIALDFWDIDAMTSTICSLLDHPSDRNAMVNGQLADVSTVTWSAAAEKVKNVYGQILE
jgi:glycosyltransferase involved in cell wall biosynthesis